MTIAEQGQGVKRKAEEQTGGFTLLGMNVKPGDVGPVKKSPFKQVSPAPQSLMKTVAQETAPSGTPTSPKIQALKAAWDSSNWDLDTQQPHGGQEWSTISNFVEDFSVTTNFLGPPKRALMATGVAIQEIEHYPPANFEPYHSELAAWISPDDPQELSGRLMLGNGASELIDLVTRVGAHAGAFKLRSDVQYKEYERAALADGRAKINDDKDKNGEEKFSMLAVVNPCNPTGEYLPVEQLKKYIEDTCQNSTTVLVDESMQLWHGPDWRKDSLVSQGDWVKKMYKERDTCVYVIHSWTKIWTCPGIRLGSIIGPTRRHIAEMKKHQVPWSLNVFALRFLSACIKDADFMQDTWEQCRRLRARTVDHLAKMFPEWKVYGEPWLSWLWIDTKSAEVANNATRVAKAAGVPIRNGAMGYKLPTFIRLKVTSAQHQDVLFKALKQIQK